MVARVHGEVFLLLNLVVDFVLLVMAGRLAGLRPAYLRCALAGLFGGVYALWALLHPGSAGAAAVARTAIAAVLILAAYFPAPPLRLLLGSLALLVGAALLGGIVLALAFLNQPGLSGWAGWSGSTGPAGRTGWAGAVFPLPLPWGWLVWSLAVAGLGFGLLGLYRRRRAAVAWCLSAEIEVEGRAVLVKALVDTGNRLADPFSGAPVVVVELDAIQHLLPPEVCRLCRELEAAATFSGEAFLAVETEGWARRFRVIPFTTVGKVSGIMVGFRPDRLKVYRQDRSSPVVSERTVVCLYNRTLSPAGAYRALLPPELAGEEGEVA